jgi:hypothetical protein
MRFTYGATKAMTSLASHNIHGERVASRRTKLYKKGRYYDKEKAKGWRKGTKRRSEGGMGIAIEPPNGEKE